MTSGDGVPVIFISGLAANHRTWAFQLLELKRYFHLIAVDNRGIGKSKRNFNGLTIESMATDIDELLSILGFEKVHLIGSSMGGMIALEYANKNPENVYSLILSSVPFLENCGPFGAFADDLKKLLVEGNPKKIFEGLASTHFSSDFLSDRRYEILVGLFERNPYDYPAETISLQINAIREWRNLRNWTLGCSCPCMMIFGSEDKLIPVSETIDITSKIFPHAVKKVIQGAGHAVHVERHKEFNKIVLDFLRNQ